MLVNVNCVREQAVHFQKYKRYYDAGVPGSKDWVNFWNEESRRCVNGYKSGDLWVPGYLYNWLNYSPIMLAREDKTGSKRLKREQDLPDPWDLSFLFFYAVEVAEAGMSEEDIGNLPVDLNLVPGETGGGKHLVWLKGRGMGASFMGASMPVRNYFHIKDSKSYLFAHAQDYLNKDGIFNKVQFQKGHVNKNTPFHKKSQVYNRPSEMHVRASYINADTGEEDGAMSEIIGVPFGYDFEKGRGKRGKIILWEELGVFPRADKAWGITRSSVEIMGKSFGLMVGFGTGGSEGADFEPLKMMLSDPDAYNILKFKNNYPQDIPSSSIGLFTPATYSPAYKDKEGNSDHKGAKKFHDKERKRTESSPNPGALIQYKAEHPYNPSEAMMSVGINDFPVEELKRWKSELMAGGLYKNMEVAGKLIDTGEGVEFQPDPDLKPLNEYPIPKKGDRSGCVVQYFPPFKTGGLVPKDLYIVCNDPYSQDDSEYSTSVGAAYVIMNPNNIVPPGDKIVAAYVGRPNSMDIYNENLYKLARRYNAKIGFETDTGDVIGYGKRTRQLDWLEEEFEIDWNPVLASKGVHRGYGMHTTTARKSKGIIYLRDWLNTIRSISPEGVVTKNLHTIYDIGLLEELIKFSEDKNADRVSAMIIGMYHSKEILYKQRKPKKEEEYDSKAHFFRSRKYVNHYET